MSDERIAEFNERFRLGTEPAVRRAERLVIGADFGATSYTTRVQADRLIDLLELTPACLLLDVGSGSGWPGIYMARESGCRVVMVDRPFDGLRIATDRMAAENVRGIVICASGEALPLRDDEFDAATSSDVLC